MMRMQTEAETAQSQRLWGKNGTQSTKEAVRFHRRTKVGAECMGESTLQIVDNTSSLP